MKIVKNIYARLLEPKVTSSNVMFCPNSSSKPKEIQFTMRKTVGTRQYLTFLLEKCSKNITDITDLMLI